MLKFQSALFIIQLYKCVLQLVELRYGQKKS